MIEPSLYFQSFKQELDIQQRGVRAEIVSKPIPKRRFQPSRQPANYLPKSLVSDEKPKPKLQKVKVPKSRPLTTEPGVNLKHGKLLIMQGDITEADTDVIVNGTNDKLLMSN